MRLVPPHGDVIRRPLMGKREGKFLYSVIYFWSSSFNATLSILSPNDFNRNRYEIVKKIRSHTIRVYHLMDCTFGMRWGIEEGHVWCYTINCT